MLGALTLAFTQLADPRVLRILLKSVGLTLLAFLLLGVAGWYGLQWALAWLLPAAGGEMQQLLAAVLLAIAGLLLWRIVALAVMQFHADEVVEAVEKRHYPAALAQARKLGWREEARDGLKGAGRALLANAIALPFALILLVTGIGPALLFWAVNAVLLGREFDEMVWRRHRPDLGHAPGAPSPLSHGERWLLGGIVAALLIVPFINLLAPLIGAATATHLLHRKGTPPHAA